MASTLAAMTTRHASDCMPQQLYTLQLIFGEAAGYRRRSIDSSADHVAWADHNNTGRNSTLRKRCIPVLVLAEAIAHHLTTGDCLHDDNGF